MPNNPFAGTPQQLFAPEEYEQMKQRQAAAQAVAQAPPVPVAPQQIAPVAPPQETPQEDPFRKIIRQVLEALGLSGAPALPPGQEEPQTVDKVPEAPVRDPEEREVRTMEERSKKPLADTKGVVSKKTKKETKETKKEKKE